MNRISWVLAFALWSVTAWAAPPLTTKTTLTPQQKTLVDARLRVTFAKIDRNNDGFLDAEELARAFRGPKAKPAPALYDDKGNVNPEYYKARAKYPDMIYLAAMDTDDDGRISWDEYRTYGEAFAANLLSRQQALQRALLQAMRNQQRYRNRNANYNRYGRNRNPYRNYNRGYHSVPNYQRQAARQYQAMYQQALRNQQNYIRGVMRARQAMYARAQQLQHRAYNYRRR